MEDKGMRSLWAIYFISLFVLLPFLESMFFGHIFGLKWYSPWLMERFADIWRIVKIVAVLASVILLLTFSQEINKTIQSPVLKSTFLGVSASLAFLQLPFLFMGCMFDTSSDKHLNYVHQEHVIAGKTFYVRTADPGAMGKAYHYVSLKCTGMLKLYDLHHIGRIDWVGTPSLIRVNNELIVQSPEGIEQNRFDVFDFNCDS